MYGVGPEGALQCGGRAADPEARLSAAARTRNAKNPWVPWLCAVGLDFSLVANVGIAGKTEPEMVSFKLNPRVPSLISYAPARFVGIAMEHNANQRSRRG